MRSGAVANGTMTLSWSSSGIVKVELHDELPPDPLPPNDAYARGPFSDDLFSVTDGTFSFMWFGDDPRPAPRPWKLPHRRWQKSKWRRR